MIQISNSGNFEKTKRFLEGASFISRLARMARIEALAKEGVESLKNATPTRTGKTAASWGYEIEEQNGKIVVTWTNSNVNKGVNIAIIIQYGHGTRTGGYVEGLDYINPALRSVFTKMTDNMWKAVVSL